MRNISEGSGSKYTSFSPPPQQYGPKEFKLPKLDFPKFHGEHPHIWREKCEKYFSMFNVPVHVWVPFATINFKGNAELWLQTYESQHSIGSWAELCVAVEQKFGRDLHHNYMRDMLTIRQTTDVLEYAARFEQAMHRVQTHNKNMGEVFFVQKFLDGLKYSISNVIALHKPRTVDAALSLAIMQKKYWRPHQGDFNHAQEITTELWASLLQYIILGTLHPLVYWGHLQILRRLKLTAL